MGQGQGDLTGIRFNNRKLTGRMKRVLDIGCNTGLITIQIAQRFHPYRVTGVDIDEDLIAGAQRQGMFAHIFCLQGFRLTVLSSRLRLFTTNSYYRRLHHSATA